MEGWIAVNPYIIIAVLLTWAASLGAMGWWQHGQGGADCKAHDLADKVTELAGANAKIRSLIDRNLADQDAHAAELAAIGEKHAKEMEDADQLRLHDVAAARNGAIRLRLPGACEPADRGAVGQVATGAGRGDDSAGSELPGEVAANLLELADDADRNTKQLAACQAVVINDRKESP